MDSERNRKDKSTKTMTGVLEIGHRRRDEGYDSGERLQPVSLGNWNVKKQGCRETNTDTDQKSYTFRGRMLIMCQGELELFFFMPFPCQDWMAFLHHHYVFLSYNCWPNFEFSKLTWLYRSLSNCFMAIIRRGQCVADINYIFLISSLLWSS